MRWTSRFALLCVAAIGCTSSTFAAFTTVNAPIFQEDSRAQILSHIYSGTFVTTGPGNLNYTNGTITATRIEDTSTPLQLIPAIVVTTPGPAGSDDQIWQGGFEFVSAEAKFAAFDQEFGYFPGTSGGSYVKLFEEDGSGYNVDGSKDLTNLDLNLFRWARGGHGRVFTSQISDNSDGKDHMITYRITGLTDNKLTWLLMWEDKFKWESSADYDFNDLVVELKGTINAQIPEPTMLMPLMGALMLVRRRRNG